MMNKQYIESEHCSLYFILSRFFAKFKFLSFNNVCYLSGISGKQKLIHEWISAKLNWPESWSVLKGLTIKLLKKSGITLHFKQWFFSVSYKIGAFNVKFVTSMIM